MSNTKLLLYNWDPIAGPAGGGVTEYIKEMIPLLIRKKYKLFFLNAGRKYDSSGKIRIEKRENIFGEGVDSYEVINSPILSPGNQSIKNINYYLEDELLAETIKKFIDDVGGFDIIHIHNLEGLSLRTLELKEQYPNTKFIYTFHNYFPICTQVNLWMKDEKKCDAKDYLLCGECYKKANYDLTRFRFEHIDIPELKRIFMEYSTENPDADDKSLYRTFREKNVEYFNKYIDVILAVSGRTHKIITEAGILDTKSKVCYVGTEVAKNQNRRRIKEGKDGALNIVYMGYMRKEKGFDFFIQTLKNMPDCLSAKIKVTIVSRHIRDNLKIVDALEIIKYKFAEVCLLNGYKDYMELESILKEQHLGIIPVLWEDNLPRVAIEQMAMGVPLLTSDLGGAAELGGNNPDFVFRAGDETDFLLKLSKIESCRWLLDEYWEHAMQLVTMQEHVNELDKIYLEVIDES